VRARRASHRGGAPASGRVVAAVATVLG
jgi:hypothetical protein